MIDNNRRVCVIFVTICLCLVDGISMFSLNMWPCRCCLANWQVLSDLPIWFVACHAMFLFMPDLRLYYIMNEVYIQIQMYSLNRCKSHDYGNATKPAFKLWIIMWIFPNATKLACKSHLLHCIKRVLFQLFNWSLIKQTCNQANNLL